MQTLHLLAILCWIASRVTALPKWQLEFENSTQTGSGEPPEIWVKAFDPTKEGIVAGKKTQFQ